jgi:glycosyltransferase involved in cell wall biosynthesis
MMVAQTPRQFADEVVRLLSDLRERRRLGAAARAWVTKEYSWSVIGERLRRAYEAALHPDQIMDEAHMKL